MARRVVVFVAAILCCLSLNAQAPNPAPKKRIAVRAGRLIDGKSEKPIANAMILVEDGACSSMAAEMLTARTIATSCWIASGYAPSGEA